MNGYEQLIFSTMLIIIFFLVILEYVDNRRIKALEKEIESIKKDIIKIINVL